MTTQEQNILNAIITTKDVLTKVLSNGIKEESKIYDLVKAIGNKFDLNQKESIIVFEESLKLI